MTTALPLPAPLPADPLAAPLSAATSDLALVFADKLTGGATPELVEEIRTRTPLAWFEDQLNPDGIAENPELDAALATFPTLSLVGYAKREAARSNSGLKEQQLAAVLRATWSNRHLLQVMTGFWHDHFNVAMVTGRLMWFAADYDAAIRANALGRFDDLLMATAKSAAMMTYLNNDQSRWPEPNENYAREVMELHTLGVGGGYTEDDIKQVSRALTGWGTTATNAQDTAYGFAFHPDHHYSEGPIDVMDWHADAMSGEEAIQQGESLLGYLAHHPSTARFLSAKLVRRFLGDGNHSGLVDQLAQVYLANDTAIAPWLRALVTSPEFAASSGQKLRRPLEHLVAGLRALRPVLLPEGGHQSLLARGLLPLLGRLGHAPFTWPAPDGYPDEGLYWAASGSVLARWNGLLLIASDSIQGARFDTGGLLRRSVDTGTVGEMVDALAARFLVRPLAQADRDALIVYLGVGASSAASAISAQKFRVLCALVMSTHTAQVR